MTGGNQNNGSEKYMSPNSKEEGTNGENRANATKTDLEELLKKAGFFKAESQRKGEADSEGEGEGEGEEDDSDARIRAALKQLKSLKRAEDDLAKLGYTRTPPTTAEGGDGPGSKGQPTNPLKDEDEDDGKVVVSPDQGEEEDEKQADAQSPPIKPGGGTVPVVKSEGWKTMSKSDRLILIKAAKLAAAEETRKTLDDAKRLLSDRADDDNILRLTAMKQALEKSGDKEAAALIESRIQVATTAKQKRLEAQKQTTSQASIPPAEPTFAGSKPTGAINMQTLQVDAAQKARFDNAVKTEFLPIFRASFRNVVFVKEQGAD
jgi:hypothetical protein